VAQVRRCELQATLSQGAQRQFRGGEGYVPSGRIELPVPERTFGVPERLPVKAGGLRLIERRF
jgi:hypothetical protein